MNLTQLPFPILLIAIPLLVATIIPVLGWWKKKLCYPIVIIAILASLLSSLKIMTVVLAQGPIQYHLGGWKPPWGIECRLDHLNALLIILISFISLIIAIFSKKSVEKELPNKEVLFYCLFLLLFTGLLGIVVTGDLFNLYVFLEISSLSAYALIGIGEDKAPFASFRYIIVGTIGACFYLLGVGYLYAATGSLNMMDLAQILPTLFHSKTIIVAFSFFLAGIGIKMALFPLHVWLPDSYTYAPSTVSAFIAPLMTKVGAYIMIKIMYVVFGRSFSIELVHADSILSWIAAIGVIAGCILALAQSDIKRMLAYIIVAEVGYIALGVGMANRNGLIGAILHIINDAFMMACLFLVVGAIMYKTGTRNIHQFKHFNKKMPFTMGAFTISALSMIGVPPACGFFSKWYLLLGALDTGNFIFAAVILIIGLFNAILFFRIIENIYFNHSSSHDEGTDEIIFRDEAPLTMLIPILIMASGIILLGVFSGKLVSTIIQFAVPRNF